ncbi:DUF1217 domain-containing protein [Acidisphaera sp. L21]|uniref:DUF1217 domain-containing protein n=1 Tax=Acidisphaera sp. L21 TaxID=1641851 RepID=UPI00131B6A1C|nr:DUF1217 domain-containing protein [Acidisphaera sp. L21]
MSSVGGLGSLVLSLFNSTDSSDSSGLLSTIYASSSGTVGASGDPIAALKYAEANSDKEIATTAADPTVARDIAAFRTKVAAATDPATLLKDPTVLKVLLTANGLGDQVSYTALAQKALLSDTTQSDSLASQLSTTWKSVAATYDFANKGLSIIQNPKVLDTLANGYAEVTWRDSLDATTPGLSEALSFRDQASTITSVDQILGDSTLRSVVTTALNIPEQIAFQDIPAQENAITSKLDITRFKDPKFVESFVTQYLIAAGNAASSSDSSGQSLDSLAYSARGLVV